MTSAIGNQPRPDRGFTIIEIVLVLGLIAIAGTIVIANFTSIADRGGKLSTEETLRAAIRQARFSAASTRSIVSLSYDEEDGVLSLSSGDHFPLDENYTRGGRGQIRFFLIPPAKGLDPFQAPEKTRLETREVHFAPDRSSSPFVVEIDSGTGSPERHAYDPFSSLERSSQ
jgi:prepilin-type N-terminal cleavage/methylation domain-containing protein